jgi:uncharacterized integral membrane protein
MEGLEGFPWGFAILIAVLVGLVAGLFVWIAQHSGKRKNKD